MFAEENLYPMLINPISVAVGVVLFALWVAIAPRMNADAVAVQAKRKLYMGLFLGAGALGILLALLSGLGLGIAVYALGLIGVGALYTKHRNKLVDPSYRIFTKAWLTEIKDRWSHKPIPVDTKIRLYDCESRAVLIGDDQAGDRDLVRRYNHTQSMLFNLAYRRAAEVEFIPTGVHVSVKYIIDGIPTLGDSLSMIEFEDILAMLIPVAGINPTKLDTMQKGQVRIDQGDEPTDLIVRARRSEKGLYLYIQVVQELVQTDLDALGMAETQKTAIDDLFQTPGVVLVVAPKRSGRTSLFYSILRKRDAFLQQIVTFEKSTIADLPNITQNEYQDPALLEDMIVSALRRDPDIAGFDNCEVSGKAARRACEFSAEHRVVFTIPASDVFTAVGLWMKLVGDPKLALSRLRGVVAGNLLRVLCPECKQQYSPDAGLLKKLGLPSSIRALHRVPLVRERDKKGEVIVCGICRNVGYLGRTGMYEVLTNTTELSNAILAGKGLADLKPIARGSGYQPMQVHSIQKAVKAITSIEEIVRIASKAKSKKQ